MNSRASYFRQPVTQPAVLKLAESSYIPCEIRNFCQSGVFFKLSGPPPGIDLLNIGANGELVFSTPDKKTSFRIAGKVVHHSTVGLGFVFGKPASFAALRFLQEKALPPSRMEDSEEFTPIREQCRLLLEAVLNYVLNKFHVHIETELLEQAQKSKTAAQQAPLLDAVVEMQKNGKRVCEEFLAHSLAQAGNFVVPDLGLHPEADALSAPIISRRVEFQDWANLIDRVFRLEDKHEAILPILNSRFCVLVRRDIDNFNNPFGPSVLCHSFRYAIGELDLSNATRKICYEVFAKLLEEVLENLYTELVQLTEPLAPWVPAISEPKPAGRAKDRLQLIAMLEKITSQSIIEEATGPSFSEPSAVSRAEQEPRTKTLEETRTQLPGQSPTGQFAPPKIQTAPPDSTLKPVSTMTTISGALLDSLGGNLTASSSLAPDQDLSVGVILKERFVLQEILGKGGMGTVFKALDLRKLEANDRDTFVALKVLNRDFRTSPVALIALQREAKRAQTLSHPNIITVYDFDRDGAHVFMSMEFLHGQSLSGLIKDLQGTGLPFKQAWPFIDAMGQALAYAHKKNIIHSDFKPSNVFVSDQNEIKVLDFGIACAAGRSGPNEEKTVFNARELGALTPAYASLGQSRGLPPDPRDDIYALACVVYELLSGKHPYGRLSAEKALELDLQVKPIPGLKHKPWKALQRGLALQQEERIANVEEFLELLQPQSKLYHGAWAAGILAAITIGISLYLNLGVPPTPIAQVPATPKADQHRKIEDLLKLAGIRFEAGNLTAPAGSNALWAYQEVLKLDPGNEKAIAGLGRIADTLEQNARILYENGDRAQSLMKVMEGLQADPHHEGLLQLKRELEKPKLSPG
ncbi:MAG: DUF1631 family protein [Methylococcaceae bacterium]|nr:DUF1631 family protein [Methylococcaceae bacterium]